MPELYAGSQPALRPLYLQSIYEDYKMRREGLLLALIDGAVATSSASAAQPRDPPLRPSCSLLQSPAGAGDPPCAVLS